MKVLVSHNNTAGYFRYQKLGSGSEQEMSERYNNTSRRIINHAFQTKAGKLSDGTEYKRMFHHGTVVTLFIVDEKKAKMMLQ